MQEEALQVVFLQRTSQAENQETMDDDQARKNTNGCWREFRAERCALSCNLCRFHSMALLCELAKVIMIMDINGFISKH